jgi:pimeloyl-ACP methyl ester carboxylesterase
MGAVLGGRPTGAAAVVVLAVLVSGCGGVTGSLGAHRARLPSDSTTTSPTTTTTPGPPITPVSWAPCQDGLQCGSVAVPLDYFVADSPTIEIAVARHPAEDPAARIGSLVINPGGPGGSGIDDLPSELSVLTSGLLQHFDIVSFDPRGVDRSSPVTCGESGGAADQGLIPDPAPTTPAGQQTLLADDQDYAQQCEKASSGLLPFVGTVDVARDLDRIRAALGDAQLTYIGHSYGTLLGLTYAQMFPTHVRAMVLDGVIDPAVSAQQMVTDQAVGFENVLNQFFSWCRSSGCAWQEGADPLQSLLSLNAKLVSAPIPAGSGRQAGPGELFTAVLSALYTPSGWPRLATALARAEGGDGAQLVSMTDSYNTENGPNAVDADNAVSCLDHPAPRDVTAYPQLASGAGAQAPFFGPALMWGLLQCSVWATPPTRTPAPVTAQGAPPILLVSSSGDPATPHQWAESVESELAHAALVTWQGSSHVAYYYSACVRSIDQAYVLNGTLPANGTVCSD